MTISSLLVFTTLLALQADVRVSADVSPTSVQVGEQVTLSIVIETPGPTAHIRMPSLPPGLEVLSSQDFSELRFSMPGGRRRLIRREMILLVRGSGRFEIPSVVVTVDGAEHRTRSLQLVATGAATPPPRTSIAGDGEVVFTASLRPDTAYVGQQVTLRSEAVFDSDVRLRLRRAPEYLTPTASGFWEQELPSIPFERRIGEGRVYEIQGFRRAYFPLTPGRHVLPPARLRYEVRRGFLYPSEVVELASDSLELVVLPIPDVGRPASFTGAVGRYRIRSSVQPRSLPAGEAATLRIEVEGVGNVRGLPPPVLPELAGVEMFAPSEEASVRRGSSWIGGVKTFTWVIVPRREGQIELPIEYGYFDPVLQEFAVASGDPLWLDVTGGATVAAAADPASIRPVHAAPARARLAWVRSPLFIALQATPLLFLAAGTLVRRRAAVQRPSERALRRRRKAALERLLAASGVASVRFFRDLEDTVRESLVLQLEEPRLERAPTAQFAEILTARGVSDETAGELAELLGRLQRAPYEPTLPAVAERRALIARATRLLAAVEATRSRRWASTATVIAALAAAALFADAAARPAAAALDVEQDAVSAPTERYGAVDAQAAFEAAVAAFAAGRYAEAAGTLAAYVEEHPGDPAAWYNLGNAYFMGGDAGRAAWAWLHGLRIAPRDGDARHNLAVAGVDERLVLAATPWLPLSREETILLLSLCWFAVATTIGIAVVRPHRRRAVIAPAMIATGLGLLLAASLAGELRERPAVVIGSAAALLSAPARGADLIRPVEPASGVRVVDRRGEWLRVRSFAGVEGWIHTEYVGEL